LSDATRILESIEHGGPKVADELLPLVYSELRKLAAPKMANKAPNQTLPPTALVYEAWRRLVGNDDLSVAVFEKARAKLGLEGAAASA
jgi:hypothetical protein